MRYTRYCMAGIILVGGILSALSPTAWYQTVRHPVSSNYLNQAHKAYSALSEDPFLNTDKIKKYQWTRSQFDADTTISSFTISENIEGVHVDRKSSTAIVMVPGLGTPVEYMAPFISIFSGYDLYILQNRGHGLATKWYDIRPVKRLWHLDSSCRLGAEEHHDIIALTNYLRSTNQYDKIVGFGTCFGSFCIAKAEGYSAEQDTKLFDELILYSGWKSVSSIVDKYAYDLRLLLNPRHPIPDDYADYKKWYYPYFKSIGHGFANWIFSVNVEDLDLESYLPYITIPTLFIHPRLDSLTKMPEFVKMWILSQRNNTTQSCAVIFDCEHSHIHLKKHRAFAKICHDFIDTSSIQEFLTMLTGTSYES